MKRNYLKAPSGPAWGQNLLQPGRDWQTRANDL